MSQKLSINSKEYVYAVLCSRELRSDISHNLSGSKNKNKEK